MQNQHRYIEEETHAEEAMNWNAWIENFQATNMRNDYP